MLRPTIVLVLTSIEIILRHNTKTNRNIGNYSVITARRQDILKTNVTNFMVSQLIRSLTKIKELLLLLEPLSMDFMVLKIQ